MSEDHSDHEEEHHDEGSSSAPARKEAPATGKGTARNAAPAPAHPESSNDNTETPKAAPAGGADFISVKVMGQDNSEVYFKIKKHPPLRKLMDAYCTRVGANPQSMRFLYDGRRIQADQTAKDLGMEDQDTIDVMLQQTGGCY